MTLYCRCDHPNVTKSLVSNERDKCLTCAFDIREASTVLLHDVPIPAFASEPRVLPADAPPWRFCPDCGVENNEHKPRCPRANWNVDKYTPLKANSYEKP